jgi:hypothetical protein
MSRRRVSGGTCRVSGSEPVGRRPVGSSVATAVLALLGAGLWLSACGSIPIPRREMLRLYESAIVDTLEVEPSEVVTDLTVIRPGQPGLDWADGRVRMTSWTHRHRLLKPNREPTLRRELWVTPGGAVEDFCRPLDTSARELELRLEQLLGLAPGAGAGRRFIDLWVDPADLFRPCPDPAVDRVRCSPEVDPREIPKEHREWLAETAEAEYRPARRGGHPWTGLGYTYDWGNPYSDVGLTELVVRPGAKVRIGRVASTREYCRRR